MKQVVTTGVLFCLFSACNSEKSNIVGKWKEVLPAYKLAEIESFYKSNIAEINALTEIEDGLADQYATTNLDTLKARMIAELKAHYEPQAQYLSYEFTKEGHLNLLNDKNGKIDSTYTYQLVDNDLNTALVKESGLISESLFDDGGNFGIVNLTHDSLIMTISGGTFVDTVYLVKENSKH